jgi:hypothetical protein
MQPLSSPSAAHVINIKIKVIINIEVNRNRIVNFMIASNLTWQLCSLAGFILNSCCKTQNNNNDFMRTGWAE